MRKKNKASNPKIKLEKNQCSLRKEANKIYWTKKMILKNPNRKIPLPK